MTLLLEGRFFFLLFNFFIEYLGHVCNIVCYFDTFIVMGLPL